MTTQIVDNIDCLVGLRAVAMASQDLIFADPPFNIDYQYGTGEYQDKRGYTEYLDWCDSWLLECYRVLKPSGSLWLAIGDKLAAELKIAACNAGFIERNWIIWAYNFGVNCTNNYSLCHTHLLYFVKSSEFYFNPTRIPSDRQEKYSDDRADPRGKIPPNMWFFPRICGTFQEREGWHPCQMPLSILRRIIGDCCPLEGFVLDPFAGSATTLCAAKELGRNALGFESSDNFASRGNQRITEHKVCMD